MSVLSHLSSFPLQLLCISWWKTSPQDIEKTVMGFRRLFLNARYRCCANYACKKLFCFIYKNNDFPICEWSEIWTQNWKVSCLDHRSHCSRIIQRWKRDKFRMKTLQNTLSRGEVAVTKPKKNRMQWKSNSIKINKFLWKYAWTSFSTPLLTSSKPQRNQCYPFIAQHHSRVKARWAPVSLWHISGKQTGLHQK